MSRSILRTAALAAALSVACAAHAGDDGFSWRFSGFGSAGYTATTSDEVLLANPGQYKGAQEGGSALVDLRGWRRDSESALSARTPAGLRRVLARTALRRSTSWAMSATRVRTSR